MINTAKRVKGTQEYYFSKKLREIAALNQSGADIINLGIGSPDMPPPKAVLETLAMAVKKSNVHGYQNYKGIPALRLAYANWYDKTYGVKLDPESEILPLIGSKEGITYISNTYIEEGDEVLIPNPGYPAYAAATKIAGGRIRYYDLDETNNWLPDLEKLSKEDLSKVKLMWVNYPHMPSGAKASKAFLKSIVEFTKTHDILLCNDNPYSLILNDEPLSILEHRYNNVLELNSLSKSHNMAGWRMGVLSGSEEHINNILITKSNVDSGMFLPIQEAAIVALQQNDVWYDSLNANYRQRRVLVWEMMDVLGCTFNKDQAGLFIWAKIPETIENVEEWIDSILQNAQVFITPGFIFGSRGSRYIRISLCTNENLLNEALNRIKKFQKHKILQQ